MNYHVGRVLADLTGLELHIVTTKQETRGRSYFSTEFVEKTVDLRDLPKVAAVRDVLIASPSFSSHWLGLALPCTKVMYVQGFNTYRLLDCFYDRYVCVSGFCADFLRTTYGIEAPVVPAFVDVSSTDWDRPWRERPPKRVLIHTKGDGDLMAALSVEVRQRVAEIVPEVVFEELRPNDKPLPHNAMLQRLASSRYLLTLSVAEGFGLVPLEAMALGVTVAGFDGYGGREYMRPGQNCCCVPFPEVDKVVQNLAELLTDTTRAEMLGNNGRVTATCFNVSTHDYRLFRNVGERNANHDNFVVAELTSLQEGGEFFDVLAIHRDDHRLEDLPWLPRR
jgi:hypothetical protein